MNIEEYQKFVSILKEWHKKRVNQKLCVVCKNYDGSQKLPDGSLSVFSECHRENMTYVFPYYHSCDKFEAKPIEEFIDIYFKE